MATPNSRETLVDWCLRKLGAGVIELNVSEEQLCDRVDEALLLFQQFHMDAVEKVYLAHQMTSLDITNQYIQIPPPVISVTGIVPVANSNASMGFFDIRYQLMLNDMYTFTSTSIVYYDRMQAHLALLDFEFNVKYGIEFTRHQSQLRILLDWTTVNVGDYYIIECYRILDPDQYPDVYNDTWLKNYLTCLIKLQWADNMSKFSGVQLPGGVTMNGIELHNQAMEEKALLEQQLQDTFQEPINFFMG